MLISIHAPREGGDVADLPSQHQSPAISIHAPREGGDDRGRLLALGDNDFNPRPP